MYNWRHYLLFSSFYYSSAYFSKTDDPSLSRLNSNYQNNFLPPCFLPLSSLLQFLHEWLIDTTVNIYRSFPCKSWVLCHIFPLLTPPCFIVFAFLLHNKHIYSDIIVFITLYFPPNHTEGHVDILFSLPTVIQKQSVSWKKKKEKTEGRYACFYVTLILYFVLKWDCLIKHNALSWTIVLALYFEPSYSFSLSDNIHFSSVLSFGYSSGYSSTYSTM